MSRPAAAGKPRAKRAKKSIELRELLKELDIESDRSPSNNIINFFDFREHKHYNAEHAKRLAPILTTFEAVVGSLKGIEVLPRNMRLEIEKIPKEEFFSAFQDVSIL